jgi:hypothetical protein
MCANIAAAACYEDFCHKKNSRQKSGIFRRMYG